MLWSDPVGLRTLRSAKLKKQSRLLVPKAYLLSKWRPLLFTRSPEPAAGKSYASRMSRIRWQCRSKISKKVKLTARLMLFAFWRASFALVLKPSVLQRVMPAFGSTKQTYRGACYFVRFRGEADMLRRIAWIASVADDP